jgi:hypothetical protein
MERTRAAIVFANFEQETSLGMPLEVRADISRSIIVDKLR